MLLAIVEKSHSGAEFGYRLQAAGIPAGSVFTLVSWPVTQREPGEVLNGVTFDETGVAVCAGRPGTCGDPAKPNDPIDLFLHLLPASQCASRCLAGW